MKSLISRLRTQFKTPKKQARLWATLMTGTALLAALAVSNCRTPGVGTSRLRDDVAADTSGQCEAVCAETTSDRGWARCKSCRCKAAMDGWLPTADELQCMGPNTTEIPVYVAQRGSNPLTLTQITQHVPDCFNPPRLADARGYDGGCNPGSRLGQIEHGDIRAKFICRHEKYTPNWRDPNEMFDDMGVIIHNNRTGATCYYDDVDHTTNSVNNPGIDLSGASDEQVDANIQRYYRQEASSCIGCHDNDPFMYSPYLKGAKWKTDEGYTGGPYWRLGIDGEKKPIGKVLVGPDLDNCTSCHRIGASGTCHFAMDSVAPFVDSLHPFLKGDAGGLFGVTKAPDGQKWSYPVWMPLGSVPATRAAWNNEFGKAVETLKRCCPANAAARNDPDQCQWDDIPLDP